MSARTAGCCRLGGPVEDLVHVTDGDAEILSRSAAWNELFSIGA